MPQSFRLREKERVVFCFEGEEEGENGALVKFSCFTAEFPLMTNAFILTIFMKTFLNEI